MLRSSLLLLVPMVMCATEPRGNDGVEYYGTSNVRYQKTYPPPRPLRERPPFIPITTVNPPLATRPEPVTAGVPKIDQLNVTTASGPLYISRRRPLLLPRPNRPGSRSKQPATQSPLFFDSQSPQISTSTIPAPKSLIVFSKPSSVPIVPEKESVSLVPKSEVLPEVTTTSRPETEPILPSTPNFPKTGQVSHPLKLRPQITFVPVLDSESLEEPNTVLPSVLNKFSSNQQPASEIPPIVAANHTIVDTFNISSISVATQPPITKIPSVVEIQVPAVSTAPKPPGTETDSQVISAPSVIIQVITSPQLPSNPASQPPVADTQPSITSVQLNLTRDTQPAAAFISTPDITKISEVPVQSITDSASVNPESELTTQSEQEVTTELKPKVTSQPELEVTTQPEPETITQSTEKPPVQTTPNLPIPEPYTARLNPQLTFVAIPDTDQKLEAVDVDTTVTPLLQKIEPTPNSVYKLPPSVNTTPQPLAFIPKSNAVEELQPIESVSTHTIAPESYQMANASQGSAVVNTQTPLVSAPHIIIQVIAPSQASLSSNSQLPVYPTLNPPIIAAPTSRLPEISKGPYQPIEDITSKLSDSESELTTPPESVPQLALAPHLETETTSQPETEILPKSQSYPVKLRPQVIFVPVNESVPNPVTVKPQPVLPPFLPRPNPIRKPDYGRYSPPTTQSSITASMVPPTKPPQIITPTQTPILTKPNTIGQPSYSRYTRPTTQHATVPTTQSTTKAHQPTTSTPPSLRPGSLKLDFVCKKGNGYYAVDNECNTYIQCQQNNATKFSCPDGLYFNPAAKYNEYPCFYSSEVQCVGGNGKQYPIRQCPRQYGLFSMNDGDCSKYIMCNVGVATVMNCPAGLVFNPTTESCDWVANVPQCNPQVFKDYTCPDPPIDEYGVTSDIIYKYKYGNQCKLYIACQRGYPRLLSCERGLAFDEAAQSCINSAYVQNCTA